MISTLDIVLIIIASILVIVGIIGCFLPVIPGPPISYAGVLVAYFVSNTNIQISTLIILGVFMVIVTILDFWIPSLATKKFGGTKWGSRGCLIGMLASLVGLKWWAIFIAPFAGAFLGELFYLKKHDMPVKGNVKYLFKTALGAFVGMMCGIIIKLIYSCFVLFFVAKEFIISYCS